MVAALVICSLIAQLTSLASFLKSFSRTPETHRTRTDPTNRTERLRGFVIVKTASLAMVSLAWDWQKGNS